MASTESLPRNRRFLIEWLFLIAALLALAGFIGILEYQDYLHVKTREQERLAGQATVIEKNLVPLLLSTRRAIDGIIERLPSWQRQRDGFKQANQQLQFISDTLTGIRAILIIDADGRVLSSNDPELVGRDFSKRDYFQTALKDHNAKTLYVSPPFKSIHHILVIGLYRVIPGSRGEFAGVAMADVDPKYFATLLESVHYAPDVRTSLVHGDGKLFMMAPERADLSGKDLATPGSLFTRHRSSGQSANVFADLAYVTGDERMVAFRTIQPDDLFMDRPLVLTVGRDLHTIFARWRRQSYFQGGMFAILAVVAVLSLFLYQRRQRALDRLVDSHDLERQATEYALQASEARLHSFFDASPDPLLISTAAGIITMANQQVEHLLGYTVDELIGQSIERLVPDRFRMAHPARRAGFAASPSARRMGHGLSLKARRKDGSEVDVEVSLSRIHTTQGLFFASALRDITERKQAEAEFRIAAAAFESQEGMIVTDADGVILRVNQAFTETTGYTAEEAVGKTPRLLKSGRHDQVFFAEMWATIARTGSWQGEIWDRRKNGEVYPKWLTITAVKSDNGIVTHYVGTHTDITARKVAEDEIKHLAFYDPLTRLPNRRLLLDRLDQALATSARSGRNGALLFIDLDNFKTLNDTLGHDKGDLLLQLVAERLVTCVREGDTVARLGGDEFVVMLEDLSGSPEEAATQSETVGEKILASVNQPFVLAGHRYRSTPSIGVTLFSGHQSPIEELLKKADLAMYQAKTAGRNTLRFFDPEMQAKVRDRAALEAELHDAVRQQQFVLYYQPQVVGDGRLTGAEVLVRWQHPQHGTVLPGDFIPLAEETGAILALGYWVLQTACIQLANWATQPETAHLTLAVNVSTRQFNHKDFVDQVMAVLDHTGANPQRLKLELTESLLITNMDDVASKMRLLTAEGVGFSLDDFGTGYSSLSYLKRLPLDQLKIDRSFVRDILIDANDAAIAKMVIVLAESLGLMVIAEGVELEEQRDLLARQGCHAYQGYLFSHPLPLEDFEEFAKRV